MKYADETLELEGKKTLLARIISRLTPAPLFNLYVGTIISYTSLIGLGPILNPITNLFICLILMVALPIVPIVYRAWKGDIDLDVSEQELRTPYFFFAILCYITAYLTYWMLQCDVMRVLSAAYITVTTTVMLVTRWSKVSVHGAGTSGPGTALIILYGLPATLVILIWIAVVWSRTYLKQHTLLQSITGIFLAIIVTGATYALLWF